LKFVFFFLVFFAALQVGHLNSSSVSLSKPFSAQVERVIDGDTFVVRGDERVRLRGIDTPELNQCYGQRAKAFAVRWLDHHRVIITPAQKEKSYGRIVAYVGYRGEDFGSTLLRRGYALFYPYGSRFHKENLYRVLEHDARSNHSGIWGSC
jgi:micrococcal nuclease